MSEKVTAVTSGDTFTVINNRTGEVLSEDAMFYGRSPYVDQGFKKVFVGFLKDIVLDKEISGKAIRLLLYIIENLKRNSIEVYLYYEDVCEDLGITSKTYYNWLNILLKKEIIEKTKRPNIYRLKPYSAVDGYESIARQKAYERDNKTLKKEEKQKEEDKQKKD